MKVILGIIIGALGIGLTLLFATTIGACLGAMSGYFVGWLFDETSVKVLTHAGLQSFEMWEVGATLGFLSGFIKSSCSCNAGG